MTKDKLMEKHLELSGGKYYREGGKWYWKLTSDSTGTMVSSQWLNTQIRDAETKAPKSFVTVSETPKQTTEPVSTEPPKNYSTRFKKKEIKTPEVS